MMTSLTNKDIEFLSNQELISILQSVLHEIDITASSGAHRSTTYLAVSAVEGLFGELLKLLRIQPTGSTVPPEWPIDKKTGNPKPLSDLTLDERESVLKASGALPKDFEELYSPVRVFRNYMHPERELKNRTPIAQSIAQLALSCLNALIEKYKDLRFVGLHEWHRANGVAKVLTENSVQMPQNRGDNASMLICELPAERLLGMTFDVIIPAEAIFNLVYNYYSLDQFSAARIEGRVGPDGRGLDSGRLQCARWRAWRMSGRYTSDSEPDPLKRQHNIKVILDPAGTFDVLVDNTKLSLAAGVDWEFDPKGRIGFMTESGAVSMLDLEVKDR